MLATALFSMDNADIRRLFRGGGGLAWALLYVKVCEVIKKVKGNRTGNENHKERSTHMTVRTNTKAGDAIWGS